MTLHDSFQHSMKERFQGLLHSLIAYLKRQASLTADIKSICHTVLITRLLSIGELCNCVRFYRIKISCYYDKNFGSFLFAVTMVATSDNRKHYGPG